MKTGFSFTSSFKSPCKINLALWIKNKRQDGYHEIETIYFEHNDLCDEIEISYAEDEKLNIATSFYQEDLNRKIPDKHNLAYKAAELFFKKVGTSGKYEIKINKQIPIQAGLGGGSSNAACVLKSLNELFHYPLKESELLTLAQELGSDVSFFIVGKTCLAKGKGEVLKSLNNRLDLKIKIVKPDNILVSTKWAYELIDKQGFQTDHKKEIENLILAMEKKDYDLFFKNIFNDFEAIIFNAFPELASKKEKLLSEGFKAVVLCGSGGALFGVKEA